MNRGRRLLLVAMSGVRVKDGELLKLGMTLPGFVERSRVIASLPSLSLLTIAALCPPHWEVEYREIDGVDGASLSRKLAEGWDLVAISTFTARAWDAYEVASEVRANGIPVVMGGLHASALPDEAIRHCDAVVVGQAESSWPHVLLDLERGDLKEIYRQEDYPPARLEHCPIPRYDLLDPTAYNRLTLQTSRGCPHHCYFCAASRTISPYQIKPIDKIRQELEAIIAIWPRPFIELADDNTFVNKGWSKDLARMLGEYDLRWFTETDVTVADDPELLDLLATSNCAQLLIGLESASPLPLKGLDARDWKLRQFEKNAERIARIQSHGVSVNGCFILGLDGHDESVFKTTDEFIKSSGLSEVQITLMTPFPGTSLFSQLHREGRLLKEVFWDECTLFDVTFRPAQMSPETLRSGFFELMESVYSPERVSARKRSFRQARRALRPRVRQRKFL